MAAVYSAHAVGTGIPLAVKVMTRGRRDARFRARFEREAKALMELRHPHVCRGYGYGSLPDGTPYIVMERLTGEDLLTRHGGGPPLSLANIMSIGRQVARGVSAAHALGVVHRDLKPDNIWLCEPSEKTGKKRLVKILDFGMSVFLLDGDTGRLTRTGEIMGTPNYMAPEQAQGGPTHDPRIDVYGLMAVLYHLVAGQPPHGEGQAMEVVLRKIAGPPPDLTEHRPDLPDSVVGLFRRALATVPDDRPPSMAALGDELAEARDALRGSVGTAVPIQSVSVDKTVPVLVVYGEGRMPVVVDAIRRAGGRTLPLGGGRLAGLFAPAPRATHKTVALAQRVLGHCDAAIVVTLDSSGRADVVAIAEAVRGLTVQRGQVTLDQRTAEKLSG